MDLKAEHFERQVHTVEQDRDNWEKKYEVRHSNPWLVSTHARLSTGSSPEIRGVQGRARPTCHQHGRAVITPDPLCVGDVGLAMVVGRI